MRVHEGKRTECCNETEKKTFLHLEQIKHHIECFNSDVVDVIKEIKTCNYVKQ